MRTLQLEDFDAFFEAVHGFRPFRWQSMLLHRAVESGWPEGIDLPTASGKTACLDVAVFALALKANRSRPDDRAPRRIFFVVDRRVIVDAAYDRARKLETALRESTDPAVVSVAGALRSLSTVGDPLIACRMRGGAARDLRWRLNPTQPAIITGTVDQVGSRLLFCGYGTTDQTASIDAALTACDSLLLIDEAHCAVPFLETARSVQRYSGSQWAYEPVVPPLSVSVLSATLPDQITDVFPHPTDRDEALSDPELRRRIEAPKRARLEVAKPPGDAAWTLGKILWRDELVLAASQAAADFLASGHKRIGVMVNRVGTAVRLAEQLRSGLSLDAATVVVMTGRMRPADRDHLIDAWEPLLKSRPKHDRPELKQPLIVVTTQCLEVGADFSFDALVTECASLDSLRQRFGRMDRLGDLYFDAPSAVPARVLIRPQDRKKPTAKQVREGDVDPVYGASLPATWKWLWDRAQQGTFDFGISVLETMVSGPAEEIEPLVSEMPHAPVMLPAHLDLWVQTAPRPAASPDPAVFLHGADRGTPEARVVFRSDLPPEGELDLWRETIALLPPTGAEILTLPLGVVRRWLRGQPVTASDLSDVEGEADGGKRGPPDSPSAASTPIRFLIWRGRERTPVSFSRRRPTDQIRPNDIVVVRAEEKAASRLTHYFERAEGVPLDVTELAYLKGRRQHVLRLHPETMKEWSGHPSIAQLLAWTLEDTPDLTELSDLLEALSDDEATLAELRLPEWQVQAVQEYRRDEWKHHPYPGAGATGWLLVGRPGTAAPEDERFDDDDDTLSESMEISLSDHSRAVAATACAFARSAYVEHLEETYEDAGTLHDIGKADERFQALLRGSEFAAAAATELLAKGANIARQKRHRDRLRHAVGLPEGFRHEAVSLQLADHAISSQAVQRDLLLHLIASHHGYARPWFPVSSEDDPPSIAVTLGDDTSIRLDAAERVTAPPPHRPDSGVPERFWRLVRHFGWWGIAYLEAVLRLADWSASGNGKTRKPTARGAT